MKFLSDSKEKNAKQPDSPNYKKSPVDQTGLFVRHL